MWADLRAPADQARRGTPAEPARVPCCVVFWSFFISSRSRFISRSSAPAKSHRPLVRPAEGREQRAESREHRCWGPQHGPTSFGFSVAKSTAPAEAGRDPPPLGATYLSRPPVSSLRLAWVR